tara:strand:- start:419 stop:697 length:279 start_codon:yes stop_codon:yes gene_type:complete
MKKVLCGLVVALMMTGSGFADLEIDECKYLKETAQIGVVNGYRIRQVIYSESEIQAKEGRNNPSVLDRLIKNEANVIKEAHYYAVTWSALCD